MTIIRAIDTDYAGCRFRSRLEARWAVFFDELNIGWEYEPQGISMDTPQGRKKRYLPDFRLDNGQWVEVKGAIDAAGVEKLLQFASVMSICGAERSNDLVVFGNIPRPLSIAWPTQLHWHNGLWGFAWSLESGCPIKMGRPRVRIEVAPPDAEMPDRLIKGFPWGHPEWATDGLVKARRARFEWGESG